MRQNSEAPLDYRENHLWCEEETFSQKRWKHSKGGKATTLTLANVGQALSYYL